MTLHITDTLSKKKLPVSPGDQKTIQLYVCGITPYDYAHLGHGRCYVTFDVLYRLLSFLGYQVTYCRNFTDIDDKLLDRAQKELGDRYRYHEIATRYINAYHEDIARLNCQPPAHEPRVTDHIPEIIAFIEGLIKKGHAYTAGADVYYSVASFPEYGALSKRALEDLQVGARVERNELKRDPLDFALWKGEAAGGFWDSPWGNGRPGWHIECSALALRYLSAHIDIHGGGMDLIFPHHENERAQSEGLNGGPFVKIWMHNAFVRINQEKMSKSLGNFFTLRQLFETVDPMVLRYYFLCHNYTAPLDFALDDVTSAGKAYARICRALAQYTASEVGQLSVGQIQESAIVAQCMAFLLDDLNGSGMMGVIFDNLKNIQERQQEGVRVKAFLQQVLGLTLAPLADEVVEITPEIQQLIDERIQARAQKNWARADELRDQLIALGVVVRDDKL